MTLKRVRGLATSFWNNMLKYIKKYLFKSKAKCFNPDNIIIHRLDQFDTPCFLVYSQKLKKHALVWHYDRLRGYNDN